MPLVLASWGWLPMMTQPHVLCPQHFCQSECSYPELLEPIFATYTRKTDSSGERFLDICTLHSPHKSTPIPTDKETLIQYVAYLAKTIKHSSIKGYLAAVRHLHIRSGYELDLKKFVCLQLICRGIKQSQGDFSQIHLPITITHLKLFFQLLVIPNTTNFDSIMIWAVMTLASFGFLCLREMTCNLHHTPT